MSVTFILFMLLYPGCCAGAGMIDSCGLASVAWDSKNNGG